MIDRLNKQMRFLLNRTDWSRDLVIDVLNVLYTLILIIEDKYSSELCEHEKLSGKKRDEF